MEHASIADITFYQHPPLNYAEHEIRLVKVRRDHQNVINCEIATYDLEQAPPFTALSYVWGPPAPTCSILVNNKRHDIRKKLYHFLHNFCDEDEYLWVDQLCVDQQNLRERSHQVRLMSSIYKRCTSVIMWLGGRSKKYMRAALDFKATSSVDSMATLLQHEYFTRLWVIQEILLPPEVRIFVGKNIWISWLHFSEAVMSRTHELENKGVPFTALALVENRCIQTGQEGRGLEMCIQLFSSSDCGDPRDKVYGLMGLVRAAERVDVDYTKSTHQVFLDVVRALCKIYLLVGFENSNESYHLTLGELGKNMGFSDDQVAGMIFFLSELFQQLLEWMSSEKNANGPQEIVMGYQDVRELLPLETNSFRNHEFPVERWWFDWQGERHFF